MLYNTYWVMMFTDLEILYIVMYLEHNLGLLHLSTQVQQYLKWSYPIQPDQSLTTCLHIMTMSNCYKSF